MFESGAECLRIDFHLHTEKDKEFKYTQNSFCSDYIEKLEKEQISIGLITNHNKFNQSEFKSLKSEAKKKGIFLIPGVELSVKEGQNGVHTLICFNEDEWLINGNDDINNFLNQVFTGIENRENENTRCNEDIINTIKTLNKFNKDYFIILAHIEQSSGFVKECGGGLIKSLANHPEFQQKVLAFQKLRTRDNIEKLKEWMGYEIAFVEGSDPKNVDEIGKGLKCYIKLGAYSFDAVKFSLQDYKFRLSKQPQSIGHAYIKSITLTGGKLDNTTIYFSSELNTLIGVRGSGKSSILELLRYGLNLDIIEDKKYKEGLIENTLSSGGMLSINLIDKYGKEYIIKRILNESPSVMNCNGDDINVSLNALINNPLYFGQKDLSQTKEGYEFNLLDKLLGDSLSDVDDEISNKDADLIEAILSWRSIEDIESKIDDFKNKNSDLEHKLKIFTEKGIAEKLKKQTTFNTDKIQIDKVETQLTTAYTDFEKLINKDLLTKMDELKHYKSEYNQDSFDQIDIEIDDFKCLVTDLVNKGSDAKSIIGVIEQIKEKLADDTKNLREEFADIKRQIDEPNLKADDFVQYSASIIENTNQIGELKKKKNDKELFELSIKKNIRERNELLLKEFNIYKLEIERINFSQKELSISIVFKGNKDEFKNILKSSFKGTGISETKYQKLIGIFSDFVMIFEDIYLNAGKKLKEVITDSEYDKIKTIFDSHQAELMEQKTPNQIEINYHGKPLHKHSLGQRASALVLFILTQEDNDLIIIDQPEDDLDNQVIYKELINTIKLKKPNMQFIFATHNANIPVLGDAEQVISTDYNEKQIGIISGSIDDASIQNKIVDIMEGGPDAFERRNSIYKLWKLKNKK
ncbi:TrlF family AAA-like ATPase [Clostridium sp.]|uniref:TrlF family AAA-like ATPase n=1 Tax=Clostridium sp. TaxID=1506 RepID=UPI001A40F6CF|nr:hypothetical protein [Clostridium sp.]MBK5242441.1 hypothetical protein [Clostridium sp.]